jgi:hypothetical protein
VGSSVKYQCQNASNVAHILKLPDDISTSKFFGGTFVRREETKTKTNIAEPRLPKSHF